MQTASEKRPPLTPAFWPGWLGVGFLWLLGKTPQWVGLALSHPIAWLMARLMKSRRRVAERNIQRCFPELDEKQREEIVGETFRSLGRMLFEVAWCWSASTRRLDRMGRLEGAEHIENARADGRGVLVVTAHFTCLEMGGRILGAGIPGCRFIYRPLRSPVLEWYQNRGRRRYSPGGIRKKDMRTAIRVLRSGGVVWYAPDQDFGPEQSVFVPFFGIQTATLEANVRLVELTKCSVVPMFPVYDPANRSYTTRIFPALDDFPSGELVRDLTRINAMMEEQIRQTPGQYWWIHRRFKTRPEGEPPFYD